MSLSDTFGGSAAVCFAAGVMFASAAQVEVAAWLGVLGAATLLGKGLTESAERDEHSVTGAASTTELKPGDRMPDGTIYAVISPDTGEAMYATPKDAPLTYTFNQANEYAAKLDAHGHQDWRMPTKGELNVLFQNRAAIGGFYVGGLSPAGWYWSSSQDDDYGAWGQRFSDGSQDNYGEGHGSSLRCVR